MTPEETAKVESKAGAYALEKFRSYVRLWRASTGQTRTISIDIAELADALDEIGRRYSEAEARGRAKALEEVEDIAAIKRNELQAEMQSSNLMGLNATQLRCDAGAKTADEIFKAIRALQDKVR